MKYHFDKEAAQTAVEFIENYCTHVKGELAGQPLILEDWQKKEIIEPLFGWKQANGLRKYRVAYIEVPRKNGKTTLASPVGLYLLFVDPENAPEIYSAAAERDQAAISFEIASRMVLNNPSLKERAEVFKKSIVFGSGFYKAISAEANTKHGYNCSGLIMDELHIWKSRALYDALQGGTASRSQPLTFIITTAGIRKKGEFAWEMHEYARQVKEGIIKDESFLPVIYGADDDDDPFKESTWIKANPNYGISVTKEYMKTHAKRAKNENSYLNNFKRFHLNMWVAQESVFIRATDWEACNLYAIKEDDYKGRECIGALDLASTRDFTALVFVFRDGDIYNLLPYFWIPYDTLEDRKNSDQIRAWVNEGYIKATEGNITDYNFIENKIIELSSLFDIREIAYDPWNSTQIVTNLGAGNEGANMVEFRQGFVSMSPATKEFEKLILQKKLNHGGNPVLTWMVNNMTLRHDPSGNIKPDKERSSDKIDGAVAAIMAIGRSVFSWEEKVTSIYETKSL